MTNSNAFSVDSTTDACTRGFNFCNKPITLEKNGEIIELYIIDSEGLGGVDKSQNYDIKIFTMAVLMSSMFLYNSIGVIDEAAINSLSMVTQIASNIVWTEQGS